MLGRNQRILMRNIEFIKINIVQEHIDTAQVVGRQVDFLPEEALTDILFAQNLRRFQQQGAGAAGRVIDLVDLGLAHNGKAGQQFRDLLRGKELTAALASVGGVHTHQVLIRIAKRINRVFLVFTELHRADAVQQLDKHCVALCHRSAKLVAVDINIIEQTGKVVLALGAFCRILDMTEDGLHRHVEVIVLRCTGTDIDEQFRRQDKEAFGLHQVIPRLLGLLVRQLGIVKIRVACRDFVRVDVVRQVLGNIAVEHNAQNVGFEIPAIHAPAQVVRNRPYCAVKFFAFLLFFVIRHCDSSKFQVHFLTLCIL